MRELDVLRVVDREQVKLIAGFGSTTRANARLLALTRAGVLQRTFVGTIRSGHKALYALSRKGAAAAGAQNPGIRFKPATHLVASPLLLHQLEVNEVYLAVKYRHIPVPGVRFRRWRVFREPITATLPLIPDGYCELETPHGIRAMFVEVDLGTETASVWRKKVQMYLQLALSEVFTQLSGQARFRVLVIVPSERRLASVRAQVAKSTEKIFWFASLESINRDGFWSAIWLRPTGDQNVALV